MVLCLEKYAARTVSESEDSKTAETVWNIFGAADDVAARASLIAALPAAYTFPTGSVAYVSNVAIKDVCEGTTEDVLTHQAVVSYSWKQPKPVDYIEYEFDTTGSGGSFTRTHAFKTTPVTANSRPVPNFFGAINPKSDGSIAGIQIEENLFEFVLTNIWDRAAVTTAYQITCSQLTNKINNAPFGPAGSQIPKGCCQFKGARGKITGDKWPIQYRFQVRWPEKITIRDMTITKEGYQHISVYLAKFTDTTSKRTVTVPWCCYVQDVLESDDFSKLNLVY